MACWEDLSVPYQAHLTIAEAILHWLVQNAYRIELAGECLRKRSLTEFATAAA